MTSLPHTLSMRRCVTGSLSKRDTRKGHAVTTAETTACHGSKWITTSSNVELTLPGQRLLNIPLAYCIFTEEQTVHK